MGLSKIAYRWIAESHPARRIQILTYWTRTQRHAAKKYHRWRRARIIAAHNTPWSASWYNGAICVHEHEGAWNSNTGNGYYGGMQFDSASWLANGGGSYASRADLASPHDQLLVAYHYWQSSGWNPWPNTARMCGLL